MQRALLILVGLCSAIQGCDSSPSVRLPEAFRGLEEDVRQIGYLAFSDFLSDKPDRKKVADDYVRKKQCFYNRSNPLVQTALSINKMTLKGTFSADGKFEISASGAGPTAGFSLGRTKGAEHTIELPFTASALGAIPAQYMEAETPGIANFPDAEKAAAFKTLVSNRDKLRQRIEELINSYDPQQHCPKNGN